MTPFLLLLLALVLVVLPIWVIVKIIALQNQNDRHAQRLREVETELRDLRQQVRSIPGRDARPAQALAAVAPAAIAAPAPEPVPAPPPLTPPPAPETFAPPPLSPPAPVAPPPLPHPVLVRPSALAAPPALPLPHPVAPPPPPAPATPSIDWEQFMGAKLFAWLGGLAALLAVGFFVKYSFDHDLIPAEVRVALGFLLAIGLVIGGLAIDRTRYAVTAQTLIATGVVSLYTVTFACRAVYHFPFFGAIPTFLLMVLITGTAFLLAVRLAAQVIAILGILGGFLTPVLLNTGQDNPLGLFGYIALLDVGLVAVALHRRWLYLVPLGAAGTVLMQIGWAGKFFSDANAVPAVVLCLVFAGLFLGTCLVARRRAQSAPELTWSAIALAGVCYGFGLLFISHPAVGARMGLLFSFVLLANLCLLTLAWFAGLAWLVALAATGTALLLVHWAGALFTPALATTTMGVCLGFCGFFLATYFAARRFDRSAREITCSAIALPFVAFGFALFFIGHPAVAARPGLLFTFVLVADVCLLAIAWFDKEYPKLHLVAGLSVFLLLAAWTGGRLTTELLPWALAFYLAHAALHTAFPLLLERHRPAAAPSWWSQLFPPLALLLLLLPLFKLDALSLLFWPCVLLVDLLAIGLALLTASIAAVGLVLLLTLIAAGVWIFHVPATVAAAPLLLLVIGGFSVLFFAAGIFLARQLGARLASLGGAPALPAFFGDTRTQIPALSALLPFVLLIMMTARLPLANPSPVFGLALLLVVLVLGLAAIVTIEWLPACALLGVAGLEYAWRARHLSAGDATVPLAWYLTFYAIFTVYPFVFRRRFAGLTGPWAIAALAGLAQFPLVHRLVLASWPEPFQAISGLLPALFAVAPLVSLILILRRPPGDERTRLNQLAWFGGMALLFITLIFPIQFDRQWLTLGWALEGAALLWLYHRVPHAGLRAVGTLLLCTAFARLALNPSVLSYHARSATPLLNWFLYSYGTVTVCLFLGARLLAPPRDRVLGINAPPLLATLGTVLAFLLLNLEIADFFSAPGERVLTFQFSGNFARDMTYTIAWALFALGLLLLSIWQHTRAGRYAALALLSVALLKLFLHDLARLDALYRVGALLAVAIVAIVASFAYQRFLPGHEPSPPPPAP